VRIAYTTQAESAGEDDVQENKDGRGEHRTMVLADGTQVQVREDQYALVALDPQDNGEIVAVARYDREGGTDRAEYAALVEDRLQGRGLGLGLTHALIQAARERGVKNFEALVLPENRGMIRLLSALDLPERVRREEGTKHYSINLLPEG
jgi:RimJ/RimL family protein N-acetyltransferase